MPGLPQRADRRWQVRADEVRHSSAQVLNPLMEICKEVKITGSGDPFGSIHFRNLLGNYCASHTLVHEKLLFTPTVFSWIKRRGNHLNWKTMS
jgi:hypothetical protein